MSSVHFALETDDMACYLRDLGSTNGTLLNDQPVKAAVLRDGDEIRAGKTLFCVRTEGDNPAGARPPDSRMPPGRVAAAPRSAAGSALQGSTRISYTVETCHSGLTLCRGSVAEIQPHQLASRLSETIPLYLIVDFKKVGAAASEDLTSFDYLFDWLAPNMAAMVSPAVLSRGDREDWPRLIEEGWGNDAVICLFSAQDKLALLAHLRRSLRVRPDQDDPSRGIVGYCWPSVMAPLLSHYTSEFVRQLLAGIDAVLVEFPDLPATWQVFGQGQVADLLDQLGFVRIPPEEVSSLPPEEQT
jgi:hypothetical protein